jgi:NAD+-dependent protein deacetylase SIR2
MFFARMREMVLNAPLSPTHKFLLALHATGKLLRNYTQNIDGLEDRAGILHVQSPYHVYVHGGHVKLHGSLLHLRCSTCQRTIFFAKYYEKAFLEGEAPECHWCQTEGGTRP